MYLTVPLQEQFRETVLHRFLVFLHLLWVSYYLKFFLDYLLMDACIASSFGSNRCYLPPEQKAGTSTVQYNKCNVSF